MRPTTIHGIATLVRHHEQDSRWVIAMTPSHDARTLVAMWGPAICGVVKSGSRDGQHWETWEGLKIRPSVPRGDDVIHRRRA
jgi:hypothetical protein